MTFIQKLGMALGEQKFFSTYLKQPCQTAGDGVRVSRVSSGGYQDLPLNPGLSRPAK